MNKRIIPGDGDPCPRCLQPTEIREHIEITEREMRRRTITRAGSVA
jgi:hypothetical protein